MARGRSSNRSSPVTRTSSAASSRSRSASPRRRACVQRARCAAATVPTCDDLSVSRCAWKRSPSGRATAARAEPAQLEHRRLEAGELEREARALRGAARVDHEVGLGARAAGSGEADAQRAGDRRAARIRVDELDLAAGHAPGEPGDEAAERAGADDGDAIAEPQVRVPEAVDRGFEVGREDRARRGDRFGQRVHGRRRHDIARLVRMEAEDAAPAQRRGTFLDLADAAVAVLDRRRELARLERGAHARVFAGRHLAAEDERFGAPADAAVECADAHFVGTASAERLAAYLTVAGAGDPEGAGVGGGHGAGCGRDVDRGIPPDAEDSQGY